MTYNKSDIVHALVEAGLQKDDTVFFSTSLGMVGLPPTSVRTQESLCALFLEAILEVVCDGNIIVPTYSYTFGQSLASAPACYRVDTTPAQIGPFPEYVRRQKEAIRSLDPFVSVACIGKDCRKLLDALSNCSYGENSFFERFVHFEKSKCCSIGLGPNWTPFIHYADYLAKVPHRYDKLFWGVIEAEGERFFTPWIYSVRFMAEASYPYAHIAGREAEAAGIWRYAPLGRARIYVAPTKAYFDFVIQKLHENPFYLAKGPVCDVIASERARVPYEMPEAHGFDEVWQMETGQWLGNFLVPERWHCQEARVDGKRVEPLLHSLSIDQEVEAQTLFAHMFRERKNLFFNRDWGIVAKEALSPRAYRVLIRSDFAKGIVPIGRRGEAYYAYLERWEEITRWVNGKPLKRTIYLKGNDDW